MVTAPHHEKMRSLLLTALPILGTAGCDLGPNTVGMLEDTDAVASDTSSDTGTTTFDDSASAAEPATSNDSKSSDYGTSAGSSSEVDDGEPNFDQPPAVQWSTTLGVPGPSTTVCDAALRGDGRLTVAAHGFQTMAIVDPGEESRAYAAGIFTTERGVGVSPSVWRDAPGIFSKVELTRDGDVYAFASDPDYRVRGVGFIPSNSTQVTDAGEDFENIFQWFEPSGTTDFFLTPPCSDQDMAMVLDASGNVLLLERSYPDASIVKRIASDGTVLETTLVLSDLIRGLFSDPIAAGPGDSYFVLSHPPEEDSFIVDRRTPGESKTVVMAGRGIGLWSNALGGVDVLFESGEDVGILRLTHELNLMESLPTPSIVPYALQSVHVLPDGGYLMTSNLDGYVLDRFDDRLTPMWSLPLEIAPDASLAVAPGPEGQIAVAWATTRTAVEVQVLGY